MAWEAAFLLWIQENVRCSFLSAILVPYTLSCNIGLPWIVIGLLLFAYPKNRKAGFIALFSLLIAFLLNDFCLKLIIMRTRPFDAIENLVPLVKRPHGSSCPSGHSNTAFAFAVGLFLNSKKRLGIPFLVLAVIMAFSRLYVGVHYPTDVILGAFVGSMVAVGFSKLMNTVIEKKDLKYLK